MMGQLRRRFADDRGTTLMEVVVGMALLTVFMGMFTTAMLLMSNTVNKVEAITRSNGEVNNAFLRLDRSVRYAAAISTPVRSGAANDWSVEFATTTTNNTVCTQLRVDSAQTQIQQRTWTVGSNGTSYSGLTAWTPLASNITNGAAVAGSADQPFSMPDPAADKASTSYQRLTVTLIADSGTSTTAPTRATMTFTALNSSAAATNTSCQQVAVDASS